MIARLIVEKDDNRYEFEIEIESYKQILFKNITFITSTNIISLVVDGTPGKNVQTIGDGDYTDMLGEFVEWNENTQELIIYNHNLEYIYIYQKADEDTDN